MPLDNSLFNDFKLQCLRNVGATKHLPNDDDDDRKFSLATPKEVARTMQRTWDGTAHDVDYETRIGPQYDGKISNGLQPARIIEDVDKVRLAIERTVRDKGAINVDVKRDGHRKPKSTGQKKKGTGPQAKKQLRFHTDAIEALDERVDYLHAQADLSAYMHDVPDDDDSDAELTTDESDSDAFAE